MDPTDNVLAHYGKKGMKWGVRKDSGPSDVTVSQNKPGTRVKATGGKNQPASEDAKTVAGLKQKARASTTDALTNSELKAAVQRMQLEQQYSQLATRPGVIAKGQKLVKELLGVGNTANQAIQFQNSPAGQQLRDRLKK